jgi:hypothetical protein
MSLQSFQKANKNKTWAATLKERNVGSPADSIMRALGENSLLLPMSQEGNRSPAMFEM